MLHLYCPTIENATSAHAKWYEKFRNAFILCQLSNKLLLTYIESYVENITKHDWIHSFEYREKIKENPAKSRSSAIYELDIEDVLNQIILDFSQLKPSAEKRLALMGLKISGFYDDFDVNDLSSLKKSISEEGWHDIIKGILNIHEFSHLFSIFEDTIKDVMRENQAPGIIGRALKKHPELTNYFQGECGLSRNFLIKTWDLFLQIRNMYAHSFGYMDNENISKIQSAKDDFLNAFQNLDFQWRMLPNDFSAELFPEKKCKVGSMYLLNDSELNLFRNFIRIFTPALAKFEQTYA